MTGGQKQVQVLGTRFDALTEREAVDHMFQWSAAPARNTHTIVTVNVAILMMMRSNPALAEAIGKADMILVDGAPLVWLSRLIGAALPERVTGVDVMERLLSEGARQHLRVYLLGTTPPRLRKLVDTIQARFPGVEIVGARDGYFKPADSSSIIEQIHDSRADLLLVGMPAPFKELWCEEHRLSLNIPIVLGVGGAFDVMAGFLPRAPRAMQSLGLEWAWRLMLEPRKLWKRYLVTNSQFIFLAGKELLKRQVPGIRH